MSLTLIMDVSNGWSLRGLLVCFRFSLILACHSLGV